MLNISIPSPKTSIICTTLLNKVERNVEFEIIFIKLLGLLSNMKTKVARIMYITCLVSSFIVLYNSRW